MEQQPGRPPHLLVRMTVKPAGRERFFVSARLDLQPFSEVLGDMASPNWTLAVLDGQGVIAGRSRDPAIFVGQGATPSLKSEIETGGDSFFFALNQEGDRAYTAISTSPRTGWTSAAGVPAALVEAPLRRARLAWTVGAVAAMAAAGLGAWLLTRSLLRRTRWSGRRASWKARGNPMRG